MSSLFWIGAAAMMVAAVIVIVLPLWKGGRRDGRVRSHEQVDVALYRERRAELQREHDAGLVTGAEYQQVQAELDRQLLADTGGLPPSPGGGAAAKGAGWSIGAVVFLVPVVAIGLYSVLGGAGQLAPAQPGAAAHDMQAAVHRLAARLEQQPDDGRGWLMLGRSYTALGQPQKAVHALSRARRLLGDVPAVLISYARALAATRSRPSLLGRPAELIDKALALAPDNAQALWLSGLVAVERGDYAAASRHWQRLLSQQEPGSPVAERIRKGLAAIGSLQGQDAGPARVPAGADGAPSATATAGAAITVNVRLSADLRARAEPEDTVYVFARAIDGPPMPLAVAKARVRDLPLTVTLDDQDAMMPGRNISGQDKVEVVARVSKTGRPIASPGDLQAAAQAVVVGRQKTVSLTIDKVVE